MAANAPSIAELTSPSVPGLVSVLMPAYNHERFVERAIRSVWSQDYDLVELVIVDDGSSDSTPEIVTRLLPSSPIPMTFSRIANRGICGALNHGLRGARGEFITLLASDDFYRSDKVSLQVNALREYPGASLVHSEYIAVDEEDNPLGLDSRNDLPPAAGDSLKSILLLESNVRSVTIMAPRESFAKMGSYDEGLPNEDWQSILQFASYGPVAHVAEALVYRRVHASNYSSNLARKRRFKFEEAGITVLKDVIPQDLDTDRVLAMHCGTLIRVAAAQGASDKAWDGFRKCWRVYPSQRLLVSSYLASGVMSRVWQRIFRPLFPGFLIKRIRSLRSSIRQGRLLRRQGAGNTRERI